MKKAILALTLLLSLFLFADAEKRCTVKMFGGRINAEKAFSADGFVFFGIDYSRVRLIGDHGHGYGTDMDTAYIRDKYFNAFNSVVINETDKYNLSKAVGGKKIGYKFDEVLEINRSADPKKLRAITKSEPLGTVVVQEMLKKYDTFRGKAQGVGIVIIADQMNKFDKEAYYYVTFFDVFSLKFLFAAYVKGEPGGFGYRNYWIRPIANIFKDMAKGDWKYWKSIAK